MRRLRIKLSEKPVLIVRRSGQWDKRMVYILSADKAQKYLSGRRSRIVYIGTTGKSSRRPATSAVDKAGEAFSDLWGVKRIEVHIATCKGRRRMKTWEHLESALLVTFRDLHFELPLYNQKKGSVKFSEDIRHFRASALKTLILQFGN